MTWEDELKTEYNQVSSWLKANPDNVYEFFEAQIKSLLKKQRKEIIEINRIMWLDYFDDETITEEQMRGIDKYNKRMKLKLNEPVK